MRGTVAIAAAAVIAGGVTFGSAWAIGGGSSPADRGATSTAEAASVDHARAAVIVNGLGDAQTRARYHLRAGTLISATVCVRKQCVRRDFAEAPACPPAPATCIGTSTVTRHLRNGVTITVELA